MPQIQYSEKYFDDIYEYRWAALYARRHLASSRSDCLHLPANGQLYFSCEDMKTASRPYEQLTRLN